MFFSYRYKTLKKRNATVRSSNQQTGRSRVTVTYDAEFEKIRAIDDSLEPEVLRGPGKVVYSNVIKESDRARRQGLVETEDLSSVEVDENVEPKAKDIPSLSPSTTPAALPTVPNKVQSTVPERLVTFSCLQYFY